MNKIVTYGIYGSVERYIAVRLGKATMSIAFSGGLVDSLGIQPATFTTKNAFEQKVIENHPDFMNGIIKVIKQQVIETPAAEAKVVSVPEVTTMQEARKYLQEKGVSLEELQNKAAVQEKAKELNISFPNWK